MYSDWQVKEAHLLDVDDLTSRLLHLPQLREKVPEAALGRRLVGSEDRHLVQGLVGLLGSRELTPNNLILVELREASMVSF